MSKRETTIDEVKVHSRSFLTRFGIVLSILTGIVLFSYVATFSKYGYSRTGTAHHAFLDYPNEISTKEALDLSKFMETLDTMWKKDLRIFYPFDREIEQNQEEYWAKEIDVKDPYKRSQVIQNIAEDLGLPASKFPVHSPKATGVSDIIHGGLPKPTASVKMGIANPPNYLKIKQPPRAHVPECDPSKLHHKKTKILAFSSNQFKTTSIKLDGLFSEGGHINVRTASAIEDIGNIKENIKINFTLHAQNEDVLTHISVSEIDNDTKGTKSIHINNHHPSVLKTCLVYQLDIVFPSKLNAYDSLNLIVNHASHIEGNLKNVIFKDFSVGLGRGAIKFKDLKAENIKVGTLNGIVLGNYLPVKTLGAASVNGATRIEIAPQSKYVKSTVVSLNGPVKTIYTKDSESLSKNSNFIAHCWLCEPNVISAKNPKSIHITSSRRESIKIGYYKEICSAHVNIHSRTGESKLIYV